MQRRHFPTICTSHCSTKKLQRHQRAANFRTLIIRTLTRTQHITHITCSASHQSAVEKTTTRHNDVSIEHNKARRAKKLAHRSLTYHNCVPASRRRSVYLSNKCIHLRDGDDGFFCAAAAYVSTFFRPITTTRPIIFRATEKTTIHSRDVARETRFG